MANTLNPVVKGKICIEFSPYALNLKTVEERNEFLKMVRYKITQVLDDIKCDTFMMDSWSIELNEKEEQ